MKLSAIFSVCVLANVAAAVPSFVSQYENDGVSLSSGRRGNSIIDRLREDKRFTRFVEYIEKERGLRDDLENSEKEITLFAPTNEAFKQIEHKWATSMDENKPEIHDVLRYHIAPDSEITRESLHAGALIPTSLRLKTLNDRHQRIRVFRFADEMWLNMHSRIVESDIRAGNGVIHAVNQVLFPPRSMMEMMYILPTQFSTSLAAIQRTGLAKTLHSKREGMTAFIPSNAAWEALGMENLRYLFSCIGQKTSSSSGWDSLTSGSGEEHEMCRGVKDLKKIMEYHVAMDMAYSTDMMEKETMKLETMEGSKLTVCAKRREGEENRFGEKHRDVRKYNFIMNGGESRIMFTDMLASNGCVHMMNTVMIPKGMRLPHSCEM